MNFPRAAHRGSERAKVLFIRLSSLGDIVLTAHISKKLKELFPLFEITWLTESPYEALAPAMPWLDRVLTWNRRQGTGGFFKLISRIREEKFDILMNLQDNDRTAVLTLLSGIPLKIGYHRHFQCVYHQDIYAVLGQLGIPPCLEKSIRSSLVRPAGPSPLSGLWDKGRFPHGVALAIGASKERKRWPAARWAELANFLSKKNCLCLLVGSGEEEKRMADEISRRCAGANVLNVVNRFSLLQLFQVLADVHLVIAADTGPLHMARALGTPVIALFGPTSLSVAYTQSFNKVVCTPCEKMGCLDWKCTLPCMERISPESVEAAARTLLEELAHKGER